MGEKKDLKNQKANNIGEKESKNSTEVKNKNNYQEKDINIKDYNEYEEEQYDNEDARKRKVIIVSIVIVLLFGLTATLWFKGYDIVNYVFTVATERDEEKDKDEKEKIKEVVEEEVIVLSEEELFNIYDRVHRMANTIIIAEDGLIWGTENITKEGIEEVLTKLKGNDDNLYNDISKWLELDFGNAVDVHNYVWSKFDGAEGRAIEVNEEAIEEIKNVLSN